MELKPEEWHERFLEQSHWTASLRDFIFQQTDFENADAVLEVGCGTGAITKSLDHQSDRRIFGVDLLYERTLFAHTFDPQTSFLCADGFHLPFKPDYFKIAFCHYLLLWVKSPLDVLKEMVRVTRPGGTVIAFAEPDYASRIDYPHSLVPLGQIQTRSLRRQGANPFIGRSLPALFAEAELKNIRYGVSGFQSNGGSLPEWFQSEWNILADDLKEYISEEELLSWQELDQKSWLDGSRVLWVPTFYAIGIVI